MKFLLAIVSVFSLESFKNSLDSYLFPKILARYTNSLNYDLLKKNSHSSELHSLN